MPCSRRCSTSQPDERTPDAARRLLPEQWQRLRAEQPEVATLFPDDDAGDAQLSAWLASAEQLLANYFALEDPSRLEPAAREQRIEFEVDGLLLRGFVDRIDVSPAGEVRIVDYKTGASPREPFEASALFQMKFYALVLWRLRGVVPRQLRLIYLADVDTLTYEPDAEELLRFERTVLTLWQAVSRAVRTGDFQPSPGRLCEWCDFQAHCPAFGGAPLPYPERPVLTDPRDLLPPPTTG